MDWNKLLSSKRLGQGKKRANKSGRSPYQIDFDRLIFSPPFRRLQDKTQVFPLAESDYVRTRLTHSLEVSCIGRSLGTRIGEEIINRNKIKGIHASDFGAIIAAACLAHDLGNPPFGHSGEDAIRHWFKYSKYAKTIKNKFNKKQLKDIENYDGNAQGFRLITRLQMPDNHGGMQLTCATLGAFTKYPIESTFINKKGGASHKKCGFFQSEKYFFKEIAKETGLIQKGKAYKWSRHPLSFLVEATDDITYRLIDYEDGFKLDIISFNDISDKLIAIIKNDKINPKYNQIKDQKSKVEYLRSKAFDVLVEELKICYLDNESKILTGKYDTPLIENIPSYEVLKEIQDLSRRYVYSDRRVVEIEAAGFEVASGLLDLFVKSANDFAKHGEKASPHSKKYLQLVPVQFIDRDSEWKNNPYIRLLNILDFYSGMTDSYAISLFKKVRGISLPGN